jgi:hypothetical protein
MVYDPLCGLCELAKITQWLYEDDTIVVILCESCEVPMAVLRDHRVTVEESLRDSIRVRLVEAASEFFDSKEFFIDETMRQIPDHLHMHARPKSRPWWF